MVTAWALGQVSPRLFRVKMITADAMERDLPTLGVVKLPVASIVIRPEEKASPFNHRKRRLSGRRFFISSWLRRYLVWTRVRGSRSWFHLWFACLRSAGARWIWLILALLRSTRPAVLRLRASEDYVPLHPLWSSLHGKDGDWLGPMPTLQPS